MAGTFPAAPQGPTQSQRWWALLLVSLAMFGNYYAYDALNPVVDLLRSQRGLDYGQVGMLSTAYNVAALLVLLAGGYAIDRWGTRVAIPLFAAIYYWLPALSSRPLSERMGKWIFWLGDLHAKGFHWQGVVDTGIDAINSFTRILTWLMRYSRSFCFWKM